MSLPVHNDESMKLKFTKMQGIGNDFVVIDAVNQQVALTPDIARRIADRNFGIGCDQILLVEKSETKDVAFRYRILNADGSEVSQCGNGARCFARFVVNKGLIDATEFAVETSSGVMVPRLLENGEVLVNMGEPILTPAKIPFASAAEEVSYPLQHNGQDYQLAAVSMGNPHGVLVVDDVDMAPVLELGAALEVHEAFPERANIGFMQVENRNRIRLRVFERGAGETLACGSGACAAVVAGIRMSLLDAKVMVSLPGGQLQVEWQGAGSPVLMSGPAVEVFEGIITI